MQRAVLNLCTAWNLPSGSHHSLAKALNFSISDLSMVLSATLDLTIPLALTGILSQQLYILITPVSHMPDHSIDNRLLLFLILDSLYRKNEVVPYKTNFSDNP